MKTHDEQPKVSRTWAIVLAVGLLGSPPALVSASPVHAGAALDAPALEVRVEPATLDAELDRARVEQRGREVLQPRASRLQPGERIVVDLAGDDHGYRVIVRAFRNGLPIADQPAPFDHEGSIDSLLIRVEARIEDAVDRIVIERARLARIERDPTMRTPGRGAEGRPDEETNPRRRFRLRIPGALAAGLGASMIAGGTLVNARAVQSPGDELVTPTVLMGAGAVLLVTGVSLLVADGMRCRRQRTMCEDSRPTLRRTTWVGRPVVGTATGG